MNKRLVSALVCGNLAGVLSAMVLAWRGRADSATAVTPLNAPSHWLYGDKALAQTRPSWRYTAVSTLIHQASSVMWACFFVPLVQNRRAERRGSLAVSAAAVTAAAALVDLKLVPHRLTPGFEHHLSRKSLGLVYAFFASGLVLGALCTRDSRQKGR